MSAQGAFAGELVCLGVMALCLVALAWALGRRS